MQYSCNKVQEQSLLGKESGISLAEKRIDRSGKKVVGITKGDFAGLMEQNLNAWTSKEVEFE